VSINLIRDKMNAALVARVDTMLEYALYVGPSSLKDHCLSSVIFVRITIITGNFNNV
jgi:hypothetical protein